MKINRAFLLAVASLLVAACASPPPAPDALRAQVFETEKAFARTMAVRDHAAFSGFIADEALFVGGAKPLRGRAAVAGAWKRNFEGAEAPFSWQPETVEVLDSGGLALSSGPVRDAKGRLVARFTSIWRRESPGVWRIVFDTGSDVCPGEDK